MPFAKSYGDANIYYEVVGEAGPVVVLLQGLYASGRFWSQIPQQIASGGHAPRRVVCIDNRGIGRSDRPRGRYRMAHLAADVIAVLDDAGVSSAVIAGVSMGGMIAQQVAIRYPERVAGLALFATTPGLPHGTLPNLRALLALLSLPFMKGDRAFKAMLPALVGPTNVDKAGVWFSDWPALASREPPTTSAFFSQLAAIAEHSVGSQLGRVTCPVVIVAGDADTLVPAKNSRILQKLFPDATLRIVRGAGHVLWMPDGRVVVDAVESLLARIGESPRSAERPGQEARWSG